MKEKKDKDKDKNRIVSQRCKLLGVIHKKSSQKVHSRAESS